MTSRLTEATEVLDANASGMMVSCLFHVAVEQRPFSPVAARWSVKDVPERFVKDVMGLDTFRAAKSSPKLFCALALVNCPC
jgi:hypothetical protein